MKKPKASRGQRKGKELSKREAAQVFALRHVGLTPFGIEKRTGISRTTVAQYLATNEAYNDPKMKELIAEVLEKEIEDLTVLTLKARQRLHDLAEVMTPLEATALMDRSFQQRRLLEGKSTANVATLAKIIKEANADLED